MKTRRWYCEISFGAYVFAFLFGKIMVSRHKNMHTSWANIFLGCGTNLCTSVNGDKNWPVLNVGMNTFSVKVDMQFGPSQLTFLFISTNQLHHYARAAWHRFQCAHLSAVGGNYYVWAVYAHQTYTGVAMCMAEREEKGRERCFTAPRPAPSLAGNYHFLPW